MILWTVQDKTVLKNIENDQVYQPDFEKSEYVKKIPELEALYDFTLKSFNELNNANVPGLVFAFSKIQDNQILPFSNYSDFENYIVDHMSKIYSMWKHFLLERDCFVLELHYENNFNPMFVDENDFQYIMPPLIKLPPYGPNAKDQILRAMASGQPIASPCPSGLAQCHMPNISKENIVHVYDMF